MSALEEFLRGLEASGRSNFHVDGMRRRIRRFLEFAGGEISREAILDFFLSLRCSPKTRLHYYRSVKQFLKYMGLGYLMDGVKPPRVPKRDPPIIGVEEVLEDLERLSFRRRVEVLLLAFTGLRPWEAHRLDWSDVDLEGCRIRVRADIAKDYEERYTFIPRSFSQTLSKVREQGYKPLELYTLQHEMRRRGCRLTPKLLRKFFIQRLEKLGVPRSVVKKLSGHRLGNDIYDGNYFNASWIECESFYRRIEDQILSIRGLRAWRDILNDKPEHFTPHPVEAKP